MSTHTPGPWSWEPQDQSMVTLDGPYHPDGNTPQVMSITICEACQRDHTTWAWGRCRAPNEANARLIAAAPDLLAALLRCRSELAWIEARDRGSIDNARSLADAAIAKATGDQP